MPYALLRPFGVFAALAKILASPSGKSLLFPELGPLKLRLDFRNALFN